MQFFRHTRSYFDKVRCMT